jgi:hypothetical protein
MLTHLPTGPADPTDPFEREPHSGLVWFAEECKNNGAPLERYIVHAESIGDRELATFFRRALAQSREVRSGERRRWNCRVHGDRRRR